MSHAAKKTPVHIKGRLATKADVQPRKVANATKEVVDRAERDDVKECARIFAVYTDQSLAPYQYPSTTNDG
jgi:hypothetical protein